MNTEEFARRKDLVRSQKMTKTAGPRGPVEQVSNMVYFRSKAELLKEMFSAFIVQCYELDRYNQFCNVEPDGRVRLRVPWRKDWNDDENLPALKDTERAAARRMLRVLQLRQDVNHLFEFRAPFWRVRVENFPTVESALNWVERIGIDAAFFNDVDTSRRLAKRSRKSNPTQQRSLG